MRLIPFPMNSSNIQPKITHLIRENQIKKAFELLIEVLNLNPGLKNQINNFNFFIDYGNVMTVVMINK